MAASVPGAKSDSDGLRSAAMQTTERASLGTMDKPGMV